MGSGVIPPGVTGAWRGQWRDPTASFAEQWRGQWRGPTRRDPLRPCFSVRPVGTAHSSHGGSGLSPDARTAGCHSEVRFTRVFLRKRPTQPPPPGIKTRLARYRYVTVGLRPDPLMVFIPGWSYCRLKPGRSGSVNARRATRHRSRVRLSELACCSGCYSQGETRRAFSRTGSRTRPMGAFTVYYLLLRKR